MIPDRPVRTRTAASTGETEAGLFRSPGQVAIMFAFWLAISLVMAFILGIYGHIAYKVFRLGWDLIF